MKLVSSAPVVRTVYTGQQPPLTATQVTTWSALILDDDGVLHTLADLTFDPSQPADATLLIAAVAANTFLTPATKAAWKTAIRQDIDDWQRLHNCRLNAQALGLPSAQITFIQNLENAAWSQVVNDFTAYSNAT